MDSNPPLNHFPAPPLASFQPLQTTPIIPIQQDPRSFNINQVSASPLVNFNLNQSIPFIPLQQQQQQVRQDEVDFEEDMEMGESTSSDSDLVNNNNGNLRNSVMEVEEAEDEKAYVSSGEEEEEGSSEEEEEEEQVKPSGNKFRSNNKGKGKLELPDDFDADLYGLRRSVSFLFTFFFNSNLIFGFFRFLIGSSCSYCSCFKGKLISRVCKRVIE